MFSLAKIRTIIEKTKYFRENNVSWTGIKNEPPAALVTAGWF
jgi:hypothetical protein